MKNASDGFRSEVLEDFVEGLVVDYYATHMLLRWVVPGLVKNRAISRYRDMSDV